MSNKYKIYFSNNLEYTEKHPYCFMNNEGVYILSKTPVKDFDKISMDDNYLSTEVKTWITDSLLDSLGKQPDNKKLMKTLTADYKAELDLTLAKFESGGGVDIGK